MTAHAVRLNDRVFALKKEAAMAANAQRRQAGEEAIARVEELEHELRSLRAKLAAAEKKLAETGKK